MLSVKKEHLDSTDWKYWRDSTNYQEGLPQFKRGIERWVNDFRLEVNLNLIQYVPYKIGVLILMCYHLK